MARDAEKRRHVRLQSGGGCASNFFGEKTGDLPESAPVIDVSESGMRVSIEWADIDSFPLNSGDKIGFRLQLDGVPEALNLIAISRRVEPASVEGHIELGLEFVDLGESERAAVTKFMGNLAYAKLKKLRGGPDAPAGGTVAIPMPGGGTGVMPEGVRTTPLPGSVPAVGKKPEKPPTTRSGRTRRKPLLGQALVDLGAIDEARLDEFLENEFSGGLRIGEALVAHGLVTEHDLARAFAAQGRLPVIEVKPDFEVRKLLAGLPKLAFIGQRCIPVRYEDGGKALVVAMAHPPQLEDVEKLSQATGKRIKVAIATAGQIEECLEALFGAKRERRETQVRYKMRLQAAYRFRDRTWSDYVGGQSSRGATEEISRMGLLIAGPLPAEITPSRITKEQLLLEVRVQVPGEDKLVVLSCKPQRVETVTEGISAIDCDITGFPEKDTSAWNKLCIRVGMRESNTGKTDMFLR